MTQVETTILRKSSDASRYRSGLKASLGRGPKWQRRYSILFALLVSGLLWSVLIFAARVWLA